MKGRSRALLGLLILLLVLLPTMAAADPFLPDRPVGAPRYGARPPLFDDDRFAPYAYTFEGTSQFNSIGHVPIYFWMNQLMVTKAWLLKLSLRIAEHALTAEFLTPYLDRAGEAMSGLGRLLWTGSGPLVTGALSLAGLWAVLLYLRGRTHRVWASLGGTLLVLMATGALLAAGSGWLGTTGNLSRELSVQAYGALDTIGRGTSGWGLVGRGGDAMWRTLVYEPWLAGEFGSREGETVYGQLNETGFLTKDVDARHLICADRTRTKTQCPYWENPFLPQRMLIASSSFAATLAVGGTVAVLGGGIILAQLALLFLLALSPVWLLVALWWPEQGRRLLYGLAMKALGALVMQVVLAVTLGLYLQLATATMAAGGGWMLRSLMLVALAIVAFRYRTAWLDPVRLVRHRQERHGERPTREQPSPRTRTTPGGNGSDIEAGQAPLFASLTAPSPATSQPLREESSGPSRLIAVEQLSRQVQVESFFTQMQALRQRWEPRTEVLPAAPVAGPGPSTTPEPPPRAATRRQATPVPAVPRPTPKE